jgi:hypothetical protein
MTRNLTAGIVTAIEGDNAEFVHLVALDFSGGTFYITTAAQDISWSSQTWTAVGGALVVGNVEESSDASGQGIDLQLSGVDQTILSALLSNDFRGRTCQVYRAHLDTSTGTIIADPVLLFEGLQLSPYEVTERTDATKGGGTVTIKTRIKGRMGVDRTRGIWSNLASHQHFYATDTFWQNAAALANKEITWGKWKTTTGGNGLGGPGSGMPSGGGSPS